MEASKELLKIVDHLIPVSQFSKGKTSQVMKDVFENNDKYIILKNNQPQAVLISVREFKEMAEKAEKYDQVIGAIDERVLLHLVKEEVSMANAKKALMQQEPFHHGNISDDELKMLIGVEDFNRSDKP